MPNFGGRDRLTQYFVNVDVPGCGTFLTWYRTGTSRKVLILIENAYSSLSICHSNPVLIKEVILVLFNCTTVVRTVHLLQKCYFVWQKKYQNVFANIETTLSLSPSICTYKMNGFL